MDICPGIHIFSYKTILTNQRINTMWYPHLVKNVVLYSLLVIWTLPVCHAKISKDGVGLKGTPATGNAHLFPIVQEGPLTNPYEGLVIGNGDLAASAQIHSHELVLTLGKGDVWDSRIQSRTADYAIKQDDLIQSNGTGEALDDHSALTSSDYVRKSTPGPTPKPVGMIKVRHPGLSNTGISSKIDISKGMLTVAYKFPEGTLHIETYIHRLKNTVMLRLTGNGKIPWISIILEKMPDYADADMPSPEVIRGTGQHQWALKQTIPGKYGVEDFTWHMAATMPQSERGANVLNAIRWPYAIQQDVILEDGADVAMAIGVATDRDGKGSALERAFELSGIITEDKYEQNLASHINAWQEFWSASSLELEDKALEALWYRALFGFACHLKPGSQAPGLNANIPIYDYTGWNGFYTWNHNVQKWYFPAMVINHPEWYEVFADLIEQHIPVFEYLADLIFELDGVYVDLMTAPFAPPERAKSHVVFGRALSHTGWLASMLYLHYEYTGDTSWLANRVYPFLSQAADFYANYLDKYQGEDGAIFPSMLLEDTPAWEEGFNKSKNSITDLMMFKKTFQSAINASDILNKDKDKQKRWKRSLKRVPDIDYGWKDGQGWYAIYEDWEKSWPDFDEYINHLQTSRWGCSGWPIFPGEFVAGDEEEGLAKAVRDVIAGTDLLHLPDKTRQLGTFHGEGNFLPFIRAGLMDKYGDLRTLLLNHQFASGQFSPFSTGEKVYIRQAHLASWRIVENQYFPILGIAEMLLQSQGSVMRLFPFWPADQSASFTGFRARGGFVVSAEKVPGEGVQATITSLLGQKCRIRWRQDNKPILMENGKRVSYKLQNGMIEFETKANSTYKLTDGQ